MPAPYYTDESVTIYHGDCRDILPSLGKVDLVLTDPPYNVGLDYSDGDKRGDYEAWTREWVVLAPRPLLVTPGMVNIAMWYRIEAPTWMCAWVKPNQCSPSPLGGFNTWEPILLYGKLAKRLGQDSWVKPISTNQPEVGDHPCPKFLPFWQLLMVQTTNDGDTVLDPFMGSGTTLRAAMNLHRKSIGIEIEERYCEIAANRCRQMVMALEDSCSQPA